MRLYFWKRFLKDSTPSYSLPRRLIDILQFQPNDATLFKEAFTHRASKQKDDMGNRINYERLEFLGDAMLGAVIAEYLFDKAPGQREGYLTQMRSKIVSRKHLNEIGKKLKLEEFLVPNSVKNSSLSSNIHGDLFEALIGAVYLDQGFAATKKFINRTVIEPYVKLEELENRIISHKSLILEWSQKNKYKLEFNTFEEKNAEDVTIFVSIVRVNDEIVAKGRGTSKKKAEENAAKRTYYSLQNKIK